MPSSGIACRMSATSRGGVMGSAQSSVPHVRFFASCLEMYAKYLHRSALLELIPEHHRSMLHSATMQSSMPHVRVFAICLETELKYLCRRSFAFSTTAVCVLLASQLYCREKDLDHLPQDLCNSAGLCAGLCTGHCICAQPSARSVQDESLIRKAHCRISR